MSCRLELNVRRILLKSWRRDGVRWQGRGSEHPVTLRTDDWRELTTTPRRTLTTEPMLPPARPPGDGNTRAPRLRPSVYPAPRTGARSGYRRRRWRRRRWCCRRRWKCNGHRGGRRRDALPVPIAGPRSGPAAPPGARSVAS